MVQNTLFQEVASSTSTDRTEFGSSEVYLWSAGFELSLIDDAYTSIADGGTDLAAQGWETSPFLVFIKTIPGRFYPIAMLALQLLLILTQRDLGPMFKAEQRALKQGKVHADDADEGQVRLPVRVGSCLSIILQNYIPIHQKKVPIKVIL